MLGLMLYNNNNYNAIVLYLVIDVLLYYNNIHYIMYRKHVLMLQLSEGGGFWVLTL